MKLRAQSRLGVPFAVTEYAEQSLEVTAGGFPAIIDSLINQMGYDQELVDRLSKRKELLANEIVHVNPWARPGQRPIGAVRLPSLYNGFGLIVSPKGL